MLRLNLLLIAVLITVGGIFAEDFSAGSPSESADINYEWNAAESLEDEQIFFGNWEITEQMPCEISVPSEYSGFDEKGEIRSRDLTENLLEKSVVISEDYIRCGETEYLLTEEYNIYAVPLSGDKTIIGCTYAKTLEIADDCLTVVFFELDGKKQEGNRDITSIDRFYIKDKNTIYASAEGCLTFKLVRAGESKTANAE